MLEQVKDGRIERFGADFIFWCACRKYGFPIQPKIDVSNSCMENISSVECDACHRKYYIQSELLHPWIGISIRILEEK